MKNMTQRDKNKQHIQQIRKKFDYLYPVHKQLYAHIKPVVHQGEDFRENTSLPTAQKIKLNESA